ncbi:MAG: transposase [Planctomycetota bacterium]
MLTQVHGVGTLTALAFLLTIEDRDRFRSSRTVGAFPAWFTEGTVRGRWLKRHSKAGDRMVRTLLVQCAHRMLAKNGRDSDLRRAGERIASRDGATAKRL